MNESTPEYARITLTSGYCNITNDPITDELYFVANVNHSSNHLPPNSVSSNTIRHIKAGHFFGDMGTPSIIPLIQLRKTDQSNVSVLSITCFKQRFLKDKTADAMDHVREGLADKIRLLQNMYNAKMMRDFPEKQIFNGGLSQGDVPILTDWIINHIPEMIETLRTSLRDTGLFTVLVPFPAINQRLIVPIRAVSGCFFGVSDARYSYDMTLTVENTKMTGTGYTEKVIDTYLKF